MKLLLASLLVFAAVASASATFHPADIADFLASPAANLGAHVPKEMVTPPSHWMKGERVAADHPIMMHIAVKNTNLDQLEELLLDVSDPASPSYGRYAGIDYVRELTKPRDADVLAVLAWLAEHGITGDQVDHNANYDMLQVETTADVAEQLLAARYHKFTTLDTSTNRLLTVVRTDGSYSLPERVHAAVDFVSPTTRFPTAARAQVTSTGMKSDDNGAITPKVLRKLYNVGTYTAQTNASQVELAAFLEQYFDNEDLQKFYKEFAPDLEGNTINFVGPNKPSSPGVESCLDVEYASAVGAGVNTTFVYTPGRQPGSPENEPFLVWIYGLLNSTNPPTVVSISYGDNEDTVVLDYAKRVNAEFQKAGAAFGISILASSGDGGVAGSQPSSCTQFIPTFPAASPWVTAVGGTEGSTTERAASLSGGGFSNRWARPSYQESFVQTYLSTATGLPSSSRYNATGNGFPDVSAGAENFLVTCFGFVQGVAGTSCSSPTFAGIVALLNDIRFASGKSSLGFLNPLFYANPGAFNDITSGSNPGCGTLGFPATTGWDPVTGLGSPDFGKLATVIKSL